MLYPLVMKTTYERFIEKIKIVDECWEWISSSDGRYGFFKFENLNYRSHRMSWMLHFGEIPQGMLICHKCDNMICVNPDHLFLGTQKDNVRDCIKKSRMNRPTGEKNNLSRFKESDIHEIRNLYLEGISSHEIAEKYSTSPSEICDILRCKIWKHLGLIPIPVSKNKDKFRYTRGHAQHSSKLTEDNVREIRKLLAQGITHREIARMYQVRKCSITAINTGRNWKHVKD